LLNWKLIGWYLHTIVLRLCLSWFYSGLVGFKHLIQKQIIVQMHYFHSKTIIPCNFIFIEMVQWLQNYLLPFIFHSLSQLHILPHYCQKQKLNNFHHCYCLCLFLCLLLYFLCFFVLCQGFIKKPDNQNFCNAAFSNLLANMERYVLYVRKK
jgi:hypothetical protein